MRHPLRLLRQPGSRWPPEHSVALRASAAGAVCTAIVACEARHELPLWFAAVAAALVGAGNVFSYRWRTRPLRTLKIVLGAVMLGAFAWFFVTVSANAASGQLAAIEGPMAVLFTTMQAAHAFDVPSRRDLGFSLAGSATLMAVAAAQAVDLSFGVFVVAWAIFSLAGLCAAWSSMSGGAPARPVAILVCTGAVLVVAALLVSFLPTPRPPSIAPGLAAAEGGGTSQPARLEHGGLPPTPEPATPAGAIGVGGYLGFAGPLDTAVRPGFGNTTVLQIRADRPTYWLAETFDSWSGRSWSETALPVPSRAKGATAPPGTSGAARGPGTSRPRPIWRVLSGGPPFSVTPTAITAPTSPDTDSAPATLRQAGTATAPDYQTFYVAAGGADLVLHASRATTVWIPTHRLLVSPDGTIETRRTFGAGSIYSVLSTVATPSPAMLAAANGTAGLTAATRRADLELPHPYPRVAALARRITASSATVVAKIGALERWMGAHTRYTTDIPPLAPGQDSVDQFLFGSRRGYCEQISTALAVMLRSLGIPAREAVGYVPGPYDPITGTYDEQAKDAHAWVQVWFPGYGWQSFDPTADVPLATPAAATTFGHEILALLRRVPRAPTLLVAGALVCIALALRRWRRRPRTWAAAVTDELERAAVRAGIDVAPGSTLTSLAAQLDQVLDTTGSADAATGSSLGRAPGGTAGRAVELASAAERFAWGNGGTGAHPGAVHVTRRSGRDHVRHARHVRRSVRRAARARRGGGPVPSAR